MMAASIENTVECLSDYDYVGRPVAVHWQGGREIVEKLIAAWRTPSGKHYRVITANGLVFDCFFSELENTWEICEL